MVVLLVLAGLMAAPAAAQSPSFIKDSASDGKGPLDVVRVALGPRKDGRLRGEITMEKAWTTADLRAGSGPAGSVCLQLYTKRVPGEDPPDYLVCASPSASGDELRGRVLRDRANGLPRLSSVATVTPPDRRAPSTSASTRWRSSARPTSASPGRPSRAARSARSRSVAATPRPTLPELEI